MKLSYKKTVFVGFAFFLIYAFWQAYDTLVPKILTDKFGLSQTVSGLVMALDNVVALFLLPFFGMLSDRCRSKLGRRTPYVLVGTLLAVLLLLPFGYADTLQAQNLKDLSGDREAALTELWEADVEIRDPESGSKVALSTLFEEKEDFTSIPIYDENGDVHRDHTDYVIPARQAYALQKTVARPGALILFMGALMLLLVAMSVFRSPAVALMPDVTVKPLRSKANAVINLMGTAGGVCILILGAVMGTGTTANALMSYTVFFIIVAALMLTALAIFLWRVREPQWASEMQAESKRLGLDAEKKETPVGEKRKLTPAERRSLVLILASVVLWFMGYNAVTSKYSVYAGSVLGMDYNTTLLIANIAAIISYIPVGFISSKFGRKKTILAGIVILSTSFFAACFLRAGSPVALMNVLFAMAGIGWATINVNSYPMVVELATGSDVGRYTGYYYTASMAAQVVTPVLSGVFLDIRFTTLFPYATLFVMAAFVTMLTVRHGDAKPDAKKTVLDGIGGED